MLLKCKLAFEGLNILEKLLSLVSKTQVQVIRELNNLKKASTDSLQDYLIKAKDLVESYAFTGEVASDNQLMACILNGLDSEYHIVVTMIRSR